MTPTTRRSLTAALALALAASAAAQTQVTLTADRDNTIFSEGADLSNGAGEYLFVGNTASNTTRRALVRFDTSTIPAGATITAVSLDLNLTRTRAPSLPVTLHRLLADWGQGNSNAAQNEGQGASAGLNDATWVYRFFNTQSWTAPGADFTPAASATTTVGGNGTYTWTSPTLVADVQSWVNAPATNFGWILRGDENGSQTAKRFNSRENGSTATRPRLRVTYVNSGGAFGACCLPANTCLVLSPTQCTTQGGVYKGDGTACTTTICLPTSTATLTPTQDNTLYESPTGALSNALGQGFVAGTTGDTTPLRRRGLVRFDVSSIPANAIVTSATLRLALGATQAAQSHPFTLHRALASWGEGTSDAPGNELNGAASTTGDATWIHRFFAAQLWAAPGGDFTPAASATATVGTAVATYDWSSPGLIADIDAWRAAPAANFGWTLKGPEASPSTQRRFESKDNSNPALRPQLIITYAIPPDPTGACCFPNTTCQSLTATQCVALGGVYRGDNVPCGQVSCPLVLEPFVDALPRPAVAQPTSGTPGGAASYTIPIREFSQKLHRDLPPTRLWGYNGTYPGPTIEARSGQPVDVTWVNDLRDAQGNLRFNHYLFVDLCLHGPNMFGPTPRVVTHLHGGHVPAASDGYPEHTILPGQQTAPYLYPNNQPPGTLWYHDHALGITRLNVYMGLAGFYLLRDAYEDALGLPSGQYEIPLAIQDRSFNPDGTLKYPGPWQETFFGDNILVNGKVWPFLNVDRALYRFRLLNGCGSRTLRLSLSNGAPITQIGTDLGLLPAPVPVSSVLIQPGERADVVIDFRSLAPGTEVLLTNDAPAPYPGAPGTGVVPNVMKFVVGAQAGGPASIPAALRPVVPIPEAQSTQTRSFKLAMGMMNPCTGDMWMINDLMWDDITEVPRLDTVEIWSFVNRSGMAHPMHMHLVAFQVLDRQDFDVVGGQVVPVGPRIPPPPEEAGWKDTVRSEPNQITRVIARFEDYTGLFAYHCHILEHEDHEMMRQFDATCYANCDGSRTVPVLNALDFACFLFNYQQQNPYANCDGSTTLPALNALDFACFLQRYRAGCN